MARNVNNNGVPALQVPVLGRDELLDQLRVSYRQEAETLINKAIPGAISHINVVLESPNFDEVIPQRIAKNVNFSHLGAGGSKTSTRSQPATVTSKPKYGKRGSKTSTKDASGTPETPTDQQFEVNVDIKAIVDIVKPLLRQQSEYANVIKMWIDLSVPRIEDGNDFGVSVQSTAAELAAQIELDANTSLEETFAYFRERAKLATKIIHYPNLDNYQGSLTELDLSQYYALKRMVADIRNNYAELLDTILKNRAKIERPRDDDDGEFNPYR